MSALVSTMQSTSFPAFSNSAALRALASRSQGASPSHPGSTIYPVAGFTRASASASASASVSAPELAPATRLRLTARGRRFFAVLTVLIATALFALAALTAPTAAVAGEATGDALPTLTVLAGDTFWGIAQLVAPDADPRSVIHDIQRLNRLDSVSLTPGQVLTIPAKYAQ